MVRPLHAVDRHHFFAGLVLEQIDGMRRVMPEQVIGPGPRLAQRVQVRAPEEKSLHVHLLDRQLARLDPVVHPLV